MLDLISKHRDDIGHLCLQHKVRCLGVFGSATADGRFENAKSDLDFLVEFLPLEPGEHADMYFGLLEGLERLVERPIDLVMTQAIRNRYFLEAIKPSREVLYAA
jgi:predicted nucleotidyltransferase